jgi:hypothetical protein
MSGCELGETRQLLADKFGARVEDAEIPAADGAVLRGWFFRAAGDNRKAVILLHGQADNRWERASCSRRSERGRGFAPWLRNPRSRHFAM